MSIGESELGSSDAREPVQPRAAGEPPGATQDAVMREAVEPPVAIGDGVADDVRLDPPTSATPDVETTAAPSAVPGEQITGDPSPQEPLTSLPEATEPKAREPTDNESAVGMEAIAGRLDALETDLAELSRLEERH